jgi:GH24 family phage-related lysozyme (muramidase)
MDLQKTTSLSHKLGDAGMALIKKWEGCARHRADGRFDAYPDPGSKDGKPWTIGWGSTGHEVRKGVIWTQGECDSRFRLDIHDNRESVRCTGFFPLQYRRHRPSRAHQAP